MKNILKILSKIIKKNKILIIGAGPVGCTVAEILSNNSYKVKIVDSRNHVAGNCYDYKNKYGNLVHKQVLIILEQIVKNIEVLE